MTFSEIQKHYSEIQDAVLSKSIYAALKITNKLTAQVNSSDIQGRYRSISETYQNMLRYSFEMAPDPQRDKIFNKLQQSILELADSILEYWIQSMDLFNRKSMLSKIAHFEASYITDPNKIVLMLARWSTNALELSDEAEPITKSEFVNLLFYYFYFKKKWNDESVRFLMQIIDDVEIDSSTKAQLISGCTLSLLRHFDSALLNLHFDLAQHMHDEIRQRALIGLFFSILVYQKRLPLYTSITNRLKAIPDDDKFQERLLAVLIQFIRASETEKITRKIQDEIVPEVLKIHNDLQDKLNLDDLLKQEHFEDKNPEWENFFKDSPDVYQKLEQFSKMQIEGADVFMGAFAMLKHFPFFKEMANWFVPFRANNPVVINSFEGIDAELDVPAFTEGLEQSTVLCNSDKYSFCLNIMHMPAEQRKMMLELFNMELKAMNEMMDDEFKLNNESKNKIINTQYIQDLYRFFKLNPARKEFSNIFDLEVDIFQSEALQIVFKDVKTIKNLGEFYFSRDRYDDAFQLFAWLNEQDSTFELLEKMGFCAQKQANYLKAIELYQQAELFDRNKIWLQKKLGFCYRKIGDFKRAIEYYSIIIKSEPKDLTNLAYLGQLHMDIENFEQALQYYYKVEYEQPDNPKVYRPIGWCSFVLGKHDNALKYFNKVLSEKPVKSDYLNIGHCFWIVGKLPEALDSYRDALRISGNDTAWFKEAFIKDSKYLKATGMDELDIMLMIDYVLIK